MNELVVIEGLKPSEVFTEKKIDEILAHVAKTARSFSTDVTTETGRKEIASLAHKIARSKTLLDDMGKEVVEGWKKQAKVIDTERKKVRDTLDALKDEIRKPLTDFEEAEKRRVDEHKFELETIEKSGKDIFANYMTMAADDIQARIKWLAEHKRDWQEFSGIATQTIGTATAEMYEVLAKRIKHDADQAELARLRKETAEREQKDREAKIAAEAAQKAKREAEYAAEQQAKAIKESAEKQIAEEKAKAEAERLRQEREVHEANQRAIKAKAEQEAAAHKAEQDKAEAVRKERERAEAAKKAEEAAAAAREADKAHHAKINNAVMSALQAVCDASKNGDDVVKNIVIAIASCKIPHTKIIY